MGCWVGDCICAPLCPHFFLYRSAYSFPVQGATLDRLRITFARSTDFFGRIVVYHLSVLGEKL